MRRGKYEESDPDEAKRLGDQCTATPNQRIFRYNPGKTLKLFPPKHPYFPKGCESCQKNLKLAYNPDSEKCRACGIINKCLAQELKALRMETLGMYKNGATVRVSAAVENRESADYERILSVATAFAQMGRSADILPRIDSPKNCDTYDKMFKDIDEEYYGKCPDLRIDGLYYYEHEGYTSGKPKKALKNMLKHGLDQSDRIIIEKCNLTDDFILRRIHGKISEGTTVSEVWEHDNGILRHIYKKV